MKFVLRKSANEILNILNDANACHSVLVTEKGAFVIRGSDAINVMWRMVERKKLALLFAGMKNACEKGEIGFAVNDKGEYPLNHWLLTLPIGKHLDDPVPDFEIPVCRLEDAIALERTRVLLPLDDDGNARPKCESVFEYCKRFGLRFAYNEAKAKELGASDWKDCRHRIEAERALESII